MSRETINKAWIGLAVILLTLFLASQAFIDKHLQNELNTKYKQAEKELSFIADLVRKRLEKKDYQLAQDFINNWGERSIDLDKITLTTNSGYQLANYSRSRTSEHVLTKEIIINYSYENNATLKLHKSLDATYLEHQSFTYELVIAYLLISATFYYMTYTIVRIQSQKQQISREIEQRILTEKQLRTAHKSLKEREKNLDITLNSIGDAVIATDSQSLITRMNPAAEKMTGWTFKDAKQKPLKEVFNIINETTRQPVDSPVEKVLLTGETVFLSNHTVLISRNGTEYHISDSAAPISSNGDKILGVILVFNDVTDRKRDEQKIRMLFQAIEQSPISVTITDTDANIEYVNNAFSMTTGYQPDEAIGKNPSILKSGKTPEKVYTDMWQTISTGNAWQGELLNRKKDGSTYWESVHIAPVLDELGSISRYLAVKEDITLRKQQEEKILHQAHFDALTNLPNRFLSLDRLSQLISEAKRNKELVAVLFLDLDDFKKINDTLGHDVGDKLLIEAADRLYTEVRAGDTVGRLGGDEFIILLGGLKHASDTHPVVENLLNRFRDAFKIDGRELILTTSLGIAIYPDDGSEPSELLRNADSAMYHSKEQGRNTYSFFTDSMNQNVARRLALEEQMHGALNRNEFSLHYQPKVNISNREIIGVEALLRWHNPELGEINPEEFISIAEQTGIIINLGQFVLTEALQMTAYWQQYKPAFSIAVNLSPRQFRDPGLVPFIAESLKNSGVAAGSLELEITEGVLMSGHAVIDNALTALSNMNIAIAMDDFGTGYSSLNYLRNYPFDILKIDRTFVNDIAIDIADRELVNTAISMAHNLGLIVVAEGVETEEQLELLASQDCEIAQGYYFSKPVTGDEITKMLSTQS